jgi:hypothetical protein
VPVDFKGVFETVDGRGIGGLRTFVLIAGAVQAALPFLLFVYIDLKANPMGDGMEWVALVPGGLICIIFAVPALLFGAINRLLAVGAALAGAGALVSIWFYSEIIREFSGGG